MWPSFDRPWPEVLELARWAEDAGLVRLLVRRPPHAQRRGRRHTARPAIALECWTMLAALAASTSAAPAGLARLAGHDPPPGRARQAGDDGRPHLRRPRRARPRRRLAGQRARGDTASSSPPPEQRVDRFAEAIEIIRRVRTEERVTLRRLVLPRSPTRRSTRSRSARCRCWSAPAARGCCASPPAAPTSGTRGATREARRRATPARSAPRASASAATPATVHRSAQALVFLVDSPEAAAKLAEPSARGPDARRIARASSSTRSAATSSSASTSSPSPTSPSATSAEQRLDTLRRFDAEVARAPFRSS